MQSVVEIGQVRFKILYDSVHLYIIFKPCGRIVTYIVKDSYFKHKVKFKYYTKTKLMESFYVLHTSFVIAFSLEIYENSLNHMKH